MLAAMTSRELGEWQAWYVVERDGAEEADDISKLGLSEQAQRKLQEKLRQRRSR